MKTRLVLLTTLVMLGGPTRLKAQETPEQRYTSAITTMTKSLGISRNDNFERTYCTLSKTQLSAFADYSTKISDETVRTLAETRFKPFLQFVNRKACNEFGIEGDADAYKKSALDSTPAGAFLNQTPLLQAMVDRSRDLDPLLNTLNEERRVAGLGPVIVADYPNSIVGGTSTIVLFPGWPGRPELHQWLQIQRTVGSMFFIALEPQANGSYASYMRGSAMKTQNGVTTIASTITGAGGSCLGCHYSSKPLRMLPDEDPLEAAKVDQLVGYLQGYPAQTHHPVYNPPVNFPGIGTGGKLTLEQASSYAGRTLTQTELSALNRNTACDRCHNGVMQNPLQPPLGATVEILMQNGFMIPGLAAPLDASARAEAIKVMTAAYKVKLLNYFQGKD